MEKMNCEHKWSPLTIINLQVDEAICLECGETVQRYEVKIIKNKPFPFPEIK